MGLRRLIGVCALGVWGVAGCGSGGCGGGDENTQGKKSAEEIAAEQAMIRSCELLVKNTDTAVVDSVAFGESVVGFSKKRGDLSAIVFVARQYTSIEAGAVVISMASGEVSGLDLDRVKSRCFDNDGEKIRGVLWNL